MAQNNRREIELALSVTTANADALSKLQQDVKALAKEGGDAAPTFQKLADELGSLAEQAKQLTSIEALTQDLQRASAAQAEAAQKSTELKQKLDSLIEASNAARAAEQQKAQAWRDSGRAIQEAQDAVTRLKNSTDQAGKGTEAYAKSLADLKERVLDARSAKRDLGAELDALKTKTREAASAVTEQGRAYKEAERDTRAATAAQRELESQINEAAKKFREAGGASIELADAQKKLGEAATATREDIRAAIAEQDRLAQAERDAANEAIRQSAIIAETKARLAAQAKAEADGILADYARMEQAQRDAAQAAKAAGDAIANAFGTVGQRSAQEIRAEIERVREAMRLLASSGAATGSELKQAMKAGESAIAGLERELRQATGTMTIADKAAGLLKNSMHQITAGNLVADAISYLVMKVKEMGAEFVQAIVQGDKMRLAFNAIYKDAGIAASQIKFLRDAANSAGVAYGDLAKDFTKFSAAMTSAGVPLKQSNELFAALTRAAGALGMSSEETSGALNALGQMASKGVVSMEELRQQLGDRLPGAMGLTARGLGITEKALIDLVSSGNLAATDVFPALTSALQDMAGATNGLSNNWERFKNLLKGFSQDMGDAGFITALTAAVKILGTALGAALLTVQAFYEGLRNVGVVAVGLSKALSGDLTGGLNLIYEELGKSRERLNNTTSAMGELLVASDNVAASSGRVAAATQGSAAAISASGAAAGAAATQLTGLAQEAVKASDGVSGLERVANLQALAIKLAGDNTLDARSKLVQFNSAAGEMMKQQEKVTEAAANNARAMKDQGDAMVGLIALRGNEQESLVAAAQASAMYQAELAKVAASRQAETDILKMQLAEREKQVPANEKEAQSLKSVKEGIEAKIKVSQSETEQAKQAAEAARQSALANDLAAKAYSDNSGKVDEYAKALENAKNWLEQVTALHKQGMATDEDVKKAKEGLSRAQYLYNDALSDTTKKIQAYGDAQKSVHSLISAGLNLALQEAASREKIARLMGDEAKAREAARAGREIELKLVQNKVDALKAEADAMEKAARAQEQELIAKGNLTEADQLRISNALRAAEAKRLEAQATEAGISAMQKEADLLGKSAEAYIKKAEAIKRKNDAAKADSDLMLSSLELRKSELDASIKIAEASGNETEATKLKIEQKRIEIQIIQETVKAQIADAEASISVAEAKMSELRATGSLTAEKRSELEGQIKSAQAKINEARARGESVRVLENEINALRNNSQGQNSNAGAINNTTAALERQNAARERAIAAQEKELQLAEREAELKRKKLGVDKDGFSVDANGNRIQQTMDNVTSLTNKAMDAGLSATQAQALANKYKPNANTGMFDSNAFWKELNELKIKAAVDAENLAKLQKRADSGERLSGMELEQLRLLGGKLPAPAPTPAPKPAPTPAPRPAPAPAPTPAPRPAPAPSGQGGSMSITPAPTYVSNYTLPAVGRATARFDTASDQADMDKLIRALTSAAGVAQ